MNETLLPLSMQSQIWEARLQSTENRILDSAETPSVLILSILMIMTVLIGLSLARLIRDSRINSYISRRKRKKDDCSCVLILEG